MTSDRRRNTPATAIADPLVVSDQQPGRLDNKEAS